MGNTFNLLKENMKMYQFGFNNPATDISLFPFKHIIMCVLKKEETPLYMNVKPLNLSKYRITLLSLQAFSKKGNPICILVELKEIHKIYSSNITLE